MEDFNTIIQKHIENCKQELCENFKFQKYMIEDTVGIYRAKPKGACYVVAGGPSLKGFNFGILNGKRVIVSNMSVFNVLHADYFITTDYTFLNHLKNRGYYENWKKTLAHKIFVANFISPAIKLINGQIVDTNYNLTYELVDFNEIIIARSAKDIGYTWETFNSGYNSGYCSFQLAVILGYNPIYLLGFDMNIKDGKTHYHKGYNKSIEKMQQNLDNYFKHFSEVIIKIAHDKPKLQIISLNPISKLNQLLPYKNIKEVL